MSMNGNTTKIDTETKDMLFQKRIVPLVVIFFCAVVLLPLGVISYEIAVIPLLCTLLCSVLRFIDLLLDLWFTETNQSRGKGLVFSGIMLSIVIEYFILFPPLFVQV